MADGFIVRKGGVTTEQALAPTITEVSVTKTSITFTITNNDAETAIIRHRLDDITDEGVIVELATNATSANITVTNLAEGTEFTVFATANVTGKVKSNVTELAIETDPLPVFTAATGGTTQEYDSGGKRFKSHTFTSSGTFTVSTVGDNVDDRNKVDYLIVAGGGGGGNGGSATGGGGGAGGYRTTNGTSGANSSAESKVVVTAQGFTITIGAGGSEDTNGSNSLALGITSTSGGAGGDARSNTGEQGNAGGSGGGSGSFGSSNGATRAGTSNQGSSGAAGSGVSGVRSTGGGGGGAFANASLSQGGDGLGNILRTGSTENRGGGGGGAADTSDFQSTNSLGGGGKGTSVSSGTSITGENGVVNTGGGGGGGARIGTNTTFITGFNGGSGIVVIRYEIAPSV